MTGIWGDLPKSQEDNTLIDDAIDAKIVDHLGDPDAHLETGQSLQSHKASEIIDHLAYSVLRDKLAFDRFAVDLPLESMDNWNLTGIVYPAGAGSFYIKTGAILNDVAVAQYDTSDISRNQSAYSQNPELQFRCLFWDIDEIVLYVGVVDYDRINGFGFKQINDELFSFYIDDDEVEITNKIYDLTADLILTLWCRYDITTNTHFWYINNVLVDSAVYAHSSDVDIVFLCYLQTTDTNFKECEISDIHFDAEYL